MASVPVAPRTVGMAPVGMAAGFGQDPVSLSASPLPLPADPLSAWRV